MKNMISKMRRWAILHGEEALRDLTAVLFGIIVVEAVEFFLK